MQSLTKNEIAWTVEALKLTKEYYTTHSQRTNNAEAALYQLRADQLNAIIDSD